MAELILEIDEKLMKRIEKHLAPKEISVERFVIHSIKRTLDSEEKTLGDVLQQYPD